MTLRLPDVTLVMVDVQCHELARLAVEDSIRDITFGEVVIFSDERIDVAGARWVKVPKWPSTDEYCRYFWYELPNQISTRWMLQIQWDGWIIDPACWTDEFLNYDYVGAPWWYNDGLNVGNGCALRSLRLMRFLAAHPDCFPLNMRQEDHLLCRIYRLTLERCGFVWAPEKLASRFALECTRPAENSRHFMFHDSFNFPAVLADAQLAERVRLMRQNPSLQRKVAELDHGRRAEILPRLAAG